MYAWNDVASVEQLVYGDTGWRDLTAGLLNGWVATNLNIRRVGSTVFLRMYNMDGTAKTSDIMYALGGGFRPSTFLYIPSYVGSPGGPGFLLMESTGNVRNAGGQTKYATGAYVEHVWSTLDTWPTTLPGTPQGTVPTT